MLPRVVNNSRFLILPGVCVHNLAFHVLSLALSRLAADWQTRYSITPLLVETFVDTSKYRGTCYKAANWELLGQTQGRGRQDMKNLAVANCRMRVCKAGYAQHTLASDFYARPTANITHACPGRAKVKAAYRFLDHEKTTMDTLLQPHYRATEARVKQENFVLAVQDVRSAVKVL